jgi:hypothetical protein
MKHYDVIILRMPEPLRDLFLPDIPAISNYLHNFNSFYVAVQTVDYNNFKKYN